jgi:hypothetical protein
MRYKVQVKPEYPFAHAQVAGRQFSKGRVEELAESELIAEIQNSPILLIEPMEDVAPIAELATSATEITIVPNDGIDPKEATDAAQVLAQRKREKRRQVK